MKYITLSFAILSLAVAGCKKTEDVDPRDQYIGTYSVTYETTERNLTNGRIDNRNSSGIIAISKGTLPNYIIIPSLNQQDIKLVNERFTMPVDIVNITGNGKTYIFERNGFGTFSGNSIDIGYVDSGLVNGQNIQITTLIRGSKR